MTKNLLKWTDYFFEIEFRLKGKKIVYKQFEKLIPTQILSALIYTTLYLSHVSALIFKFKILLHLMISCFPESET